MAYIVIYDGNCNLCTNLVQVLERLDQGDRFQYAPMQDQETLDRFSITAEDCERGMIVINLERPEQRWQGSDAAEKIGKLLPGGAAFVNTYQALPGLKWAGDRIYEQIRDHRYMLFGKRSEVYWSSYPICETGTCQQQFTPEAAEVRPEQPTS